MYIGLTDEQELLRETVARLADGSSTSDPDNIASGDRLDAQWQRTIEIGIPTLRAPALCGLEASGIETTLALQELARRLCAIPALGQGVLATELLDAAGAGKELVLVAEGVIRLAPVLNGELSSFTESPDSGVILDAAGASHALFAVAEDGHRRLLCSELNVRTPRDHSLDLTRSLYAVSGTDLGAVKSVGDPISAERWDRVLAMALTAVAADLVGVMSGALDDAVRHGRERVQFGVKIGSFQAIQHLLADALVRLEGARSCLWHAAWAVDHLAADAALLSARTAKAYASAAARDVVESAMQVLGGISITWEHLAHVRLRRTLLDRRLFGDESDQYQAIAQMRLADPDLG